MSSRSESDGSGPNSDLSDLTRTRPGKAESFNMMTRISRIAATPGPAAQAAVLPGGRYCAVAPAANLNTRASESGITGKFAWGHAAQPAPADSEAEAKFAA
jgi:hypothetical protein